MTTMRLTADFSRENQIRVIEAYLASDRVQTREGSLWRQWDSLIQNAYEHGEYETAVALWLLFRCRDEEVHHLAAGSMLETLTKMHLQDADFFDAINAYRTRQIRTCSKCGCDDAHACPGGCRWEEEDVCSKCIPFGSVCPDCREPGPDTLEDAMQLGWSMDGRCPRCDLKFDRRSLERRLLIGTETFGLVEVEAKGVGDESQVTA